MQLGTMAWRGLMRNKRRTAITAFSVAFGVLLSVTFTASGDYAYTNMINTSVSQAGVQRFYYLCHVWRWIWATIGEFFGTSESSKFKTDVLRGIFGPIWRGWVPWLVLD